VVRRDAVDRTWGLGLRATLRRLKRSSPRVLVLGDTPTLRPAGIACLAHHPGDLSRCSVLRARALPTHRDALEAATAARMGVSFAAAGPLVCPYDPCPAVIDHHLVLRDQGHLTATYSRVLSRGLERLLPMGGP
jgi:hypothetical protein